MPRTRNPVGLAAGRLILAIQDQANGSTDEEASRTDYVMRRAHTLLQASRTSSVSSLLDGRSVEEYLDVVWVEAHPAVKPSIEALIAALDAHEA